MELSPAQQKNVAVTTGDVIIPNASICHLGAIYDQTMPTETVISSIYRTICQQIRMINHIRKYFSLPTTKAMIDAFVTFHLECNFASL